MSLPPSHSLSLDDFLQWLGSQVYERRFGNDHSLPSKDSIPPLTETQLSSGDHHTTRQIYLFRLQFFSTNLVSVEPYSLSHCLRWQLPIFSSTSIWGWPWCTPLSEAMRYKIPHFPTTESYPSTPPTCIKPFLLLYWNKYLLSKANHPVNIYAVLPRFYFLIKLSKLYVEFTYSYICIC